MTTRYIVFQRPQGSRCWTMAMTDAGFPSEYPTKEKAEKQARYYELTRQGWKGGKPDQVPMETYVSAVELPE